MAIRRCRWHRWVRTRCWIISHNFLTPFPACYLRRCHNSFSGPRHVSAARLSRLSRESQYRPPFTRRRRHAMAKKWNKVISRSEALEDALTRLLTGGRKSKKKKSKKAKSRKTKAAKPVKAKTAPAKKAKTKKTKAKKTKAVAAKPAPTRARVRAQAPRKPRKPRAVESLPTTPE